MPAFGAVAVDEIDELCSGGFLPEGLGQSPLEDLCGDGSRSTPLDGRDDVFQLAQIPLPHASAAVVDASPLRVVVVRMTFDAFGFQTLHFPLLGDQKHHVRGYK